MFALRVILLFHSQKVSLLHSELVYLETHHNINSDNMIYYRWMTL